LLPSSNGDEAARTPSYESQALQPKGSKQQDEAQKPVCATHEAVVKQSKAVEQPNMNTLELSKGYEQNIFFQNCRSAPEL